MKWKELKIGQYKVKEIDNYIQFQIIKEGCFKIR